MAQVLPSPDGPDEARPVQIGLGARAYSLARIDELDALQNRVQLES